MKKIHIFTIIVCLLMCLLFSCADKKDNGNNDVYQSFVCDMANDGIIKQTDKSWWSGKSNKKDNIKKRKVIFDGSTFDCNYTYTRCNVYDHSDTDYYLSNEGIKIGLNSEDGSFYSYFKSDVSGEISFPVLENAYQMAYDKAIDYALKYIDLDDYELFVEETKLYDEITQYEFNFIRKIGHYKTGDSVSIYITDRGTLRGFYVKNIGVFNGFSENDIDISGIEKSLKNKLEQLYADKNEPYEYDIKEQTLTYSPEGDLVIVSVIEISFKESYNTGVVLATVINSN